MTPEPRPHLGDLYASSGVLRYSNMPSYGYRLVMEVDRGLADYYFALIPKWLGRLNKPMYAPHVSVVRHETPALLRAWGRQSGEEVEFLYANYVHNDGTYWWLNVFSSRLEEIRQELGLPLSSPYTRPPSGFAKCFHLTIANSKRHPHD